MIRAALICLLMLMPAVAAAQALPALYDVTGVAVHDTLNVRAGPSTRFEVLAKLPSDAAGIEVVDTDVSGEWGLINIGEGSGWVALDYMARRPGQPGDRLPNDLICSGTEPFWSFRLTPDDKATFTRDETETALPSVLTVQSENRTDRAALFADGGAVVVTAVLGRALCSDGMSDRAYGLGIDLLVTDKAEVRVYSGCCSIAP
ncbi:SH3 domain-containing protein [Roseovarius amoyensis]|uniref:SH3 domain-containing protein n=1 Tax=Roseovarius amoyensis TaxID=2211448 RepID=UPI0013A68EA5|nr:SH3 domain-containing protein [Roseovarius amoyensis]